MARYWVGGTGNWDASTTTHWASSSGGAGGASVPTSTDDVYFDLHSNEPGDTAYTVTISAVAYCQNLDISFTGTTKVTWAGSQALHIYGNLNLSGGTAQITNNYNGQLWFEKTSGTATITCNSVILKSTIRLNGGGTYQLIDELNTTGGFTNTAGTFDANNQTVTLSGSTPSITPTSAITFYNLNRTPSSPSSYGINTLYLYGNITVSNLFTLNAGTGANYHILLSSDSVGTQRTITANAISFTKVFCRDINGTGSANWDISAITGLSGDCGGNTGIIFTTPTDQHWTNSSSENWNTATNWTSRVPLPQDDVYMDCAFGTSQTITVNGITLGKSVNWTGATWTTGLTWYFPQSYSRSLWGSLTMIAGLTVTFQYQMFLVFQGRDNYTFDSKSINFGCTIANANPGGVLLLASDLTCSYISVSIGTFSCVNGENNYSITTGTITISSSVTELTLGSAIHILTGNANAFDNSYGRTITATTGTLKFTDTGSETVDFNGGGKTYGNIWFARGTSTGINAIYDSNTFNNLKDDGTEAHTIQFLDGTDQNITSLTIAGSAGKLITLTGTSTAGWKISDTTGTNSVSYCNISYSTAEGGATWLALEENGNIDSGNNDGWVFKTINVSDQLNIIEDISRTKILNINISDSITVQDIPSRNLFINEFKSIDSYSYINANAAYQIPKSGMKGCGQSFTNTISRVLESCQFYCSKTGSPTGDVTAKIYAHSGTYGVDGKPYGTALATSDVIQAADFSSSLGLVTFTFSGTNKITLDASTYYCVTMEFSGGDSISNWINIGVDSTSPTASGNLCYLSTGLVWIAQSAYDTIFYVNGNTIFSDSIAISEDIEVFIPFYCLDVSDSINITENNTLSVSDPEINIFDSLNITENNVFLLLSNIDISDQLNITENNTLSISDSNIDVSDQLNITESNTGIIDPKTVDVFDSISITENYSTDLMIINVSDQLNITESNTAYADPKLIDIYDSTNIIENYTAVISVSVDVSDSTNITEDTTVFIPIYCISVSDQLNITENYTDYIDPKMVDVFDQLDITENNISFFSSYNIDVSDSINITENYTDYVDPKAVSVSDQLNITESKTILIPIYHANVSSLINITENNAFFISYYDINVFDVINITENYTDVVYPKIINVSDSLNVTESVSIESFRMVPGRKMRGKIGKTL